jgi:hypothetical protein
VTFGKSYSLGVSMTEKVVKVGCMDPRRREDLDNGEAVMRISRAGGWLGGNLKHAMSDLLRENNAERLDISTHDKCGAAKLVEIGIRKPEDVHSSIYGTIVRPFFTYYAKDTLLSSNMEDIATEVQRKVAIRHIENWGLKSLQDLSCTKATTSGIVGDDKVLLLTTPPKSMGISDIVNSIGLKNSSTYVITLLPGKLDRMTTDPNIALALGIPKVILYRGEEDRHGIVDIFWKAFTKDEIKLQIAKDKVIRYD